LKRVFYVTGRTQLSHNWFEKHFCYAAGAELMMKEFKRHTHHQRLRGMGKARVLLKRA
jgi:hypothetical protein